MSEGDSTTRVGCEVNEEAFEQAKEKLEWGGISRVLREAIQEVAYGTEATERTRLKEKLESLRQDRRAKTTQMENLRQEREETERKIERVEERLDALMDQDGEYDGFLQSIEAQIHDGQRFHHDNKQVRKAARIGGCTPADVITDLKERNPDVPAEAFRLAKQNEDPLWNGGNIGNL